MWFNSSHPFRKKNLQENKTEILNHSCFLWVRLFFLKAFIEVKALLTVESYNVYKKEGKGKLFFTSRHSINNLLRPNNDNPSEYYVIIKKTIRSLNLNFLSLNYS